MRHFEQQLQDLLQKLVLMDSLAEAMISSAMRCLIERDMACSAEVFDKEQEINHLQVEVDETAVTLTATQQPVAADARFLFMASRIASELERIGDQAVNICQNAKHALAYPPLRPMVDIPIMAEFAQKMVRDAVTALVERSVELASDVLEQEKKVDAFKDQVFRSLLTYMMADPGTILRAMPLILVSRNLERVGDHATNIAEEVIYLVQGKDVRHRAEAKDRL